MDAVNVTPAFAAGSHAPFNALQHPWFWTGAPPCFAGALFSQGQCAEFSTAFAGGAINPSAQWLVATSHETTSSATTNARGI